MEQGKYVKAMHVLKRVLDNKNIKQEETLTCMENLSNRYIEINDFANTINITEGLGGGE